MKNWLFIVTMLFNTCSLFGQASGHDAIRKTITGLFAAMQKTDTAVMRTYFDPGARLQTAFFNPKTKRTKLVTEVLDSFLVQVGQLHSDTLHIEERITSFEIRIDEPMASVWAPYEFYVNGKLSHTGVDAFQLFLSPGGWKIIQICDTRKRK